MTVACTTADQAVVDRATETRTTVDPWNGTWKLNPEKSTAPGGRIPHPTSINIITVEGDTLTMVADHTDTEGNSEHVEYTAKLDGNEYPVTSTPPGPDPYTISLKNIDARTREFVEVLGTFTIKGRDVLSEDGMTFGRVVEMKDPEGNDASVVQFFEKQ
jgi:hypothetical protein